MYTYGWLLGVTPTENPNLVFADQTGISPELGAWAHSRSEGQDFAWKVDVPDDTYYVHLVAGAPYTGALVLGTNNANSEFENVEILTFPENSDLSN